MWKNLRDVGSLAQKIGQVVAPSRDADGSDDEEYTDDEGDYEEDEDGSYDSAAEDPVGHPQQNASSSNSKASPFGLASLLARAMDTEQHDYDESHSSEHQEDGWQPQHQQKQPAALVIPEEEHELEDVVVDEPYLEPPYEELLGTVSVTEKSKTEDDHLVPPVMDRYPSAGSSILSASRS